MQELKCVVIGGGLAGAEAAYQLLKRGVHVTLPAIGRAAGAALGVDRLVMALVGAGNIVDVRAPA